MPTNTFNQRKQAVLSKQDKSSKKSWDKYIAKLCEKINALDNYYTTSSCAGRVVIMLDNDKKGKDLFINVYHELINFKRLKNDLNKVDKIDFIKFKQEPCILHVACRTLDDANKLYTKAKLAGWKRSGIIALNKRFIVELNSTEKMEFPILDKGRILVNDDFLKLVVKRCNENLKKSWKKIEKLWRGI